MSIDSLLARLEARSVTPVTAVVTPDVTPKPLQILTVTRVTSVTPQNDVIATETDFQRTHGEALARLNAAWPTEPVNIRVLPTAPKIFQHEAEAGRLWLEARQTGRYVELLPQFRKTLVAWEMALVGGVNTLKYAQRRFI